MDISKISAGKNPPKDINVIIEVPMGADPVKYEMDKESGAIFVDRILHTAMYYPCNYGFVPHTLSDDGDPADVLVVSTHAFIPGSVVRCRPVGVLKMEDDGGFDEKILAVPATKLHPFHDTVQELTDLPPIVTQQLEHFFRHYKDLEKDKWVKIIGWEDRASAEAVLLEAIERYGKTAEAA